MSKYTTEVRFICETASGLTESVGYHSINEVISKSREKVFDFDYPIFDPQYKPVLETKILKHFYTREIGEETIGLWKLRLDRKMNEIMPYFNKLYESELVAFDPLVTVRTEKKNKGDRKAVENINDVSKKIGNIGSTSNSVTTGNENTHNTGENHNTSRDLYSDTPQGSLQNIENETYLTNARKITNDGDNSNYSNTNSNNVNIGTNKIDNVEDNTRNTNRGNITTDDYIENIIGYNGKSGSQLIKEFRETFLNIDVMIIENLEDLFMQIW